MTTTCVACVAIPRRFQTRGLFSLAQLNGIVAYEAWQLFGSRPRFQMPNRIRSYFDIQKLPDKTGALDVKAGVMDFVNKKYPDAALLASKTGVLRQAAFDQADAIMVALYGFCSYHERRIAASPEFVASALEMCVTPTADVPVDFWAHVGRELVPLVTTAVGDGLEIGTEPGNEDGTVDMSSSSSSCSSNGSNGSSGGVVKATKPSTRRKSSAGVVGDAAQGAVVDPHTPIPQAPISTHLQADSNQALAWAAVKIAEAVREAVKTAVSPPGLVK